MNYEPLFFSLCQRQPLLPDFPKSKNVCKQCGFNPIWEPGELSSTQENFVD